MLQYILGLFSGAMIAMFIFALILAGEDDHENRRR